MKLIKEDDKMIIYLPLKYLIDEIAVENLINKIRKEYKLKKYNRIVTYQNIRYGSIIELYNSNFYGLKIKINKNKLFLYEVEDPLLFLSNEIYYFNNKYYINLKESDIKIFEFSNIIYDDNVYKIIGRGIKI